MPATCYRHPNRETGVSCSSCGRPICPDCMTPTPVGMRCPECARDRTKVKTAANVRSRAGRGVGLARYTMTEILIALNVIVFVAEVATGLSLGGSGTGEGTLFSHFALDGPNLVSTAGFLGPTHQYYRLLTSGFLHEGLLHILFNMLFLYFVGPGLEQAVGRRNFLVIYLTTLFAGSFGALLFQPDAYTVGASGALFGLLGALVVIARYRRISIWQSGIGTTLLINVVFSLSVTGISIGGHLGGFAGGLICGWLYMEIAERRAKPAAFLLGCVVVAAVSVVAALAVAGGAGLTPNGLSLF
jgi:membrane associated rhomboid family serine protease